MYADGEKRVPDDGLIHEALSGAMAGAAVSVLDFVLAKLEWQRVVQSEMS